MGEQTEMRPDVMGESAGVHVKLLLVRKDHARRCLTLVIIYTSTLQVMMVLFIEIGDNVFNQHSTFISGYF